MPFTKSGYEYWELKGSGTFEMDDRGGITATRVVKVRYADSIYFARDLLPVYYIFNDAVNIETGGEHPDFANCWVTRVAVEPLNLKGGEPADLGNEGSISYQFMRATVTYQRAGMETWDWQNADVDSISFGGDFLQLPNNALTWKSDGQPIEQPQGLFVGFVEFNVIERYVLLNIEAIKTAISTVNNASFMDVAAGYLLYVGASARKKAIADDDATVVYDINHKLAYRPYKWNEAYRPGSGWEELDPHPYTESNLADAFALPVITP